MLPFDIDPTLLAWLAGSSVILTVGGTLLAPVLIVRIPADYLMREDPPPAYLSPAGAVRWVLRQALGVLLLIAGVAMLVLPGQGLLTILVAVTFLDIPKKRMMIRALLRRTGLGSVANRLRERAGKAPLRLE